MNTDNLIISPLANTEFFSVINSIIILRGFLFNNTQWTIVGKIDAIPMINDLCEFLDKNNEKEYNILALGHKLLEETDFFGSKKNESLSLNFVNGMFDQIIANIVFSKFGNTFGYLASIVNSAIDLKYTSIKEEILKNLQRQKFLNDKGTFFTLTNITIARITDKIIFPLFPHSKMNMEIIHFEYLYAQAGWLLLRSAKRKIHNTSFSKLITLAQNVEQGIIEGEIDPSALQIFQLPALLYYTYQKENGIKRKNLKSLMVSTNFWHRVYNQFFTDLNLTTEKMITFQERNPSYQFQMAFANFKNRTALADEILRKNCSNITDYEREINIYKNNPTDYYCNMQLQPNVNEIFFKQNRIIAEKYYNYEMYLIDRVFDEDLKNFIDQKNVTIKPIEDFWNNQCFRCAILSGRPILSDGIDLFQISDGGEKKMIYALIRSTNGMKLVPATDMNSFLQNEIGLNTRAKLDVPFMAEDMKSASEDDNFNTFATYIAKYREKKLLANLKSAGYEATTVENVANFFKHLIPFYSCADAINDSDTSTHAAVMACIFDSLVFLPGLGLGTSAGMKITSATMKSTALKLGAHMEALTLKEAFKAVMKIGFRIIATDIIDSFSQIITKEFIQNFGITILRSLDPGIEFSYMLTKGGVKTLLKNWNSLKSQFSIKYVQNLKIVTKIKIGTYKGYDVHVQSINEKDGFGLKTIDYHGRIVELRRIRGYTDEMPVVVISNGRKHNKYKIIDLETGKLGNMEWKEGDKCLISEVKPLRVRLKIIQVEGLSGRGGVMRLKALERIKDERNFAVHEIKEPADKQIIIDSLEQYVLENPTQRNPISIVKYWLKYKSLPPWCEEYKLIDSVLFRNLRFKSFLEVSLLKREEAMKRVTDIYGQQYIRDVINVDVDQLYDFYISHQLHDAITFDDQFALANFITTGRNRIHLDDFEALNMKIALYKTALRQYDNQNIIKMTDHIFYSVELKHYTEFSLPFESKMYDFGQITILNRQIDELLTVFKTTNDNSLIKILHKVKLHHHCLAVYLEKYLPLNSQHVVLLPNIKLSLTTWRYNKINGMNILVINWKSVDFDQSKWLADTTNKIKSLIDRS
ncbi:uncharacterized protein LOC127286007 [Leptopilina boulardi]|uniref:uncharacterized protein LOC127286007 n=1 Tax=Leptopilina boulardi TaxID=63433 RepID=UPI0021F67A60|nr:uncharacterized protein LOC127286007 [Leptopilina boulardi]